MVVKGIDNPKLRLPSSVSDADGWSIEAVGEGRYAG